MRVCTLCAGLSVCVRGASLELHLFQLVVFLFAAAAAAAAAAVSCRLYNTVPQALKLYVAATAQ